MELNSRNIYFADAQNLILHLSGLGSMRIFSDEIQLRNIVMHVLLYIIK
jgi:hypothetical protein